MSASTEEYLEALYNLTKDGRTAGTSDVSKKLNIAPASVTEMLKKLDEEKLVKYFPYQGVVLTPAGYKIAEKMTRKHRLLEYFLHEVLKIGNDKVHKEACAMEHSLSDEAERALCRTLKAPDKCPDDGQIIPACNLKFETCDQCQKWSGENLDKLGIRKANVVAVSSLKENQVAKVAFIRGDHKALKRMQDLGLTPGTRIRVNRIAPLKGPVEISLRGCKLALGDEVACNVFVEHEFENQQ
jgi:DtxR family transcriptional regulator, Mn-dependent transcriptional regulator